MISWIILNKYKLNKITQLLNKETKNIIKRQVNKIYVLNTIHSISYDLLMVHLYLNRYINTKHCWNQSLSENKNITSSTHVPCTHVCYLQSARRRTTSFVLSVLCPRRSIAGRPFCEIAFRGPVFWGVTRTSSRRPIGNPTATTPEARSVGCCRATRRVQSIGERRAFRTIVAVRFAYAHFVLCIHNLPRPFIRASVL